MRLKQRISKLEQASGSSMVEVYGLGYLYGEASDARLVPKAEFKRRAERGLAGFYEDMESGGFRLNDPKLRATK